MKVRFILEGYAQSGPDTFVTVYTTVDADVPELDAALGGKYSSALVRGVEILSQPPTQKDTE